MTANLTPQNMITTDNRTIFVSPTRFPTKVNASVTLIQDNFPLLSFLLSFRTLTLMICNAEVKVKVHSVVTTCI